MRLIDADALKYELFADNYSAKMTNQEVAKCIDNSPTIDAVPVVRGEWEPANPICPVCGEDKFKGLDADIWSDWTPAYCPNCGAKMEDKS